MSIFNVNIFQKVSEVTPPDKRSSRFMKWLYALNTPVDADQSKLNMYRLGADYPNWAAGTYNQYDRVIYGEGVYESLVNGNTSVPTDTRYWRLYLSYFIGAEERIYYNHQKLTLEWALNRRFQTTFRQPPLIPDIYITRNLRPVYPFIVGAIEEESSVVYDDVSSEFIIDSYTFATFYNFTIWFPVAVYNALSVDPAARDRIIGNFVDRYNTAGLLYNIQTY